MFEQLLRDKEPDAKAINELLRTLGKCKVVVDNGKIRAGVTFSRGQQVSFMFEDLIYERSNEGFNSKALELIAEAAEEATTSVSVLGGLTNILEIISEINKRNKRIKHVAVDVNGAQILYDFSQIARYNETGEFSVLKCSNHDIVLEQKPIFPLELEVHNLGLAKFLDTGIKSRQKLFVYASNVFPVVFEENNVKKKIGGFLASPESGSQILSAFYNNSKIETGSKMVVSEPSARASIVILVKTGSGIKISNAYVRE
ncbi:MAG: hypothetical protein ACP5T3_02170 [Candidatus Micrarchaeia archaeon]